MTGVFAMIILLGCLAFAVLLLAGVVTRPYVGRRP